MRSFTKWAGAAIRPREAIVAMCVIAAFSGLTVDATCAQQLLHVGHVRQVVNRADGQVANQPRHALVDAERIFFTENVFTTSDAKLALQFRDGSTLELGPDGMITIDEMVFNPHQSRSNTVMTVMRGTFRYTSGYVARHRNVTVNTPNGALGIRGSVVAGIVHEDLPVFIHVARGEAVFSNTGGQIALGDGQSIAVPESTTTPMNPEWMPVGVAAEALGHIESALGPVGQSPEPALLTAGHGRENAEANRISIERQAEAKTGLASGGALVPLAALPPSPAPGTPLLSEGASLGLFDGNSGAAPNGDQQAFISRTEADNPGARGFVDDIDGTYRAINDRNIKTGTVLVISGSAETAGSTGDVGQLVAVSIAANPASLGAITAAAAEAGRANPAVAHDIPSLATAIAVSAAEALPDAAHEVAGHVAKALPEAAVHIAKSVATVVPDRTEDVVSQVVKAVPEAAHDLSVMDWTGTGGLKPDGNASSGWKPVQ